MFTRYVQRELSTLSVWSESYHTTRDTLTAALSVCDKYTSSVDMLTQQFWKRYQHCRIACVT